MIRTLVRGTTAALGITCLTLVPAHAAELPAPTVSITEGQELSQLAPLQVSGLDATALSVRVEFGGLPVAVWLVPEGATAVSGGLDTWGLSGARQLTVAQCVDAEALDCGTPATVGTTVANPQAVLAPSREGSPSGTYAQDFDVTATLAVDSGTPQLAVSLDGGAAQLVAPGHVLPIDVDALDEGAHGVSADVCSSDGTRCTGNAASWAFDVVRTVPASFSLQPSVFSPGGDPAGDTVTFTYTEAGQAWDAATLTVMAAGDPTVLWSTPGQSGPGPHELSWDGKVDGVPLEHGDYTARLTVSREVDGTTVSSSYDAAFTVDRVALAPTTLTVTRAVIFPNPDGYKDDTAVSWVDQEDYGRVDLQVRDASGKQVRLIRDVAPGPAAWDGRNGAGNLVREGTYSLRLRGIDPFGNQAWSPAVTIRVDDRRLVTQTRSVTVTPKGSFVRGQVGRCSARKVPSVHGWPGSASHLSNNRCRRGFAASVVWSLHQVRLPRAVKYRTVRLGWYGGPTRAASKDWAIGVLYPSDGSEPEWYRSLDYMTGQHLPFVPANGVLDGRTAYLGLQTHEGNKYDIKTFTLRYRADVLVEPPG